PARAPPARPPAPPASPLGARVRGDRRAPADVRGQAARRDLDGQAGGTGLQLPPAGLGHPAVGAPLRPHSGGERSHGSLGLVKALAGPEPGAPDALPGRLAGGPPVPSPAAAHPLPRTRAARYGLDSDARGGELAHAQR